MAFLSALFIYPIKSLAGIQVDTWPVTQTGFAYDRQWMLVDKKQQFLSQRRLPKMALLTTRIEQQQLIVSAPQHTDLILALTPDKQQALDINIWQEAYRVNLVSPEADQWFSRVLQTPCQLVYQATNTVRPVNQKFATPQDRTAFSDGFPFLITSQASLDLLNQQMGLALTMQRFRPNLVISDCVAYAEDYWRTLQLGEIHFRLPKPCARCSVPQINPQNAQSEAEPLRTLLRTRKYKKQVYFGQNALHDNTGILQAGDTLILKSTGEARPPLKNDN